MKSFLRSNEQLERALQTIPLASQTFSKSSMNFVKGASPLFLERADGCRVWDIDGNEYVDFMLGLLPVSLGYCDPDVDGAITAQLKKGITHSLPTMLEAELAERLVRIMPCAEMVRFGKNGSDATSAAVRLARAHTGRDRILASGYHGWHDWYIGSTSRHLGVPTTVQALTTAVPAGDLDAIKREISQNPTEIAAVILEPAGSETTDRDYLVGVRELTERTGVVLIFDEIVSGFRIDIGGAQAYYDVVPDLACTGKSMANGMPISAVVGRRSIMRRMDDIFFSGTFGGEALSLAAAVATIDKLEHEDGPARFWSMGRALRQTVNAMIENHGLADKLLIAGPDWKPVARATGAQSVLVSSILRQELIEAGLLLGSTIGFCLAHDEPGVMEDVYAAWDRALTAVARINGNNDPGSLLRGEPIQPVFQVRSAV